jgi:hypothetical protein
MSDRSLMFVIPQFLPGVSGDSPPRGGAAFGFLIPSMDHGVSAAFLVSMDQGLLPQRQNFLMPCSQEAGCRFSA